MQSVVKLVDVAEVLMKKNHGTIYRVHDKYDAIQYLYKIPEDGLSLDIFVCCSQHTINMESKSWTKPKQFI
jgi:hypothetical protein